MKEKIKFLDIKDSIVEHVIIEGFAKVTNKKDTATFMKVYKENGSSLIVDFQINGIAIPFEPFLKQFEKQHDTMLKKMAMELIDEKLDGFNDFIYYLINKVKRIAKKRLGIELTRNDDY